MDRLIEILEDIAPEVDFVNCKTLIEDNMLDSFALLSLVSEIEDEFDVEILPTELTPQNFNSVESLWQLICELKNN